MRDVIIGAIAGLVISTAVIGLIVLMGERLFDGLVHIETGETGKVHWAEVGETMFLIGRIVVPVATTVGASIGVIAAVV